VNVVALTVVLVMLIPVYIAQRIAGGADARSTEPKEQAPAL
jgi:hypothetical protein